tara:strand:+ start:31 stop:240 length:210 start_codon:yes stop_codon:yes gene_type:complete
MPFDDFDIQPSTVSPLMSFDTMMGSSFDTVPYAMNAGFDGVGSTSVSADTIISTSFTADNTTTTTWTKD